MKLPGKGTLAANVVALLFVLFLYIGDVSDFLRARTAEVAAMQQLPNVTFAISVLVAAIAAALVALLAMARNAPADSKAFRVLPIVAIVAVFVDLFVLSADAPIMSSAQHMKVMLQAFSKVAHERSTVQQVAWSERDLYDMLKEFGAPPYLVKGKPLEAYALQRRENCEGPITEAPGAQVGTFLYCIRKDRRFAWVTVVGLPVEERFGTPKVVTHEGQPLFAIVTPQFPEEPESAELPNSVMLDGGTVLPEAIDGGL